MADIKGHFITIEGVEGVGKSTNIDFIRHYLESANVKVRVTREPGGTKLGEEVREILLAHRLFLPHVGITISTREPADFRENILPLGVTRMSAGVSTAVGGHSGNDQGTGQFEISDSRSVSEMATVLHRHGYQPVYKDWEAIV